MKKRILLVLFIFLIILLVVIVLLLNTKNGGVGTSPTPTPFQKVEEQGAVPAAEIDPAGIEEAKKSFRVGGLINKLPYKGENFSFYYNFGTDQFILYIGPSASSDGNTEFNSFLKQNGVDDRSWIENLVIINKSVTPAP